MEITAHGNTSPADGMPGNGEDTLSKVKAVGIAVVAGFLLGRVIVR